MRRKRKNKILKETALKKVDKKGKNIKVLLIFKIGPNIAMLLPDKKAEQDFF